MTDRLSHRTRESLLDKLRNSADRPAWDQAWQRFFDEYSPLMLAWCRRKGLQESDAEDITSGVLCQLGQRMRSFEYDPTHRFRGWLKTVIHNEVRDFFARKARRPGDYGAGGIEEGSAGGIPDPIAAAEELSQDFEAQQQWLRRAMEEVRLRVEPHTWEAFQKTAVEGRAAGGVAAELGMSAVAVYQAKSRVLELIRKAAGRLRGEPSPK